MDFDTVELPEFLGRKEAEFDFDAIRAALSGKVVLVTGAAGSIGSGLVRMLNDVPVEHIIMLDQWENGLFYLKKEMDTPGSAARCTAQMADVAHHFQMDRLYRTYRPDFVFHAAACKHVGMMETNPEQAVLTNVLGTKINAEMARKYGAEAFVLVSTDKAVHPKSMMGASKKLAEDVLRLTASPGCRFVITRFGNVWGSNGSVVPIFERQLATGMPLTLSHPDARRYFLSLFEACSFILSCAVLGRSGDTFLYDMGTPVRIEEIALGLLARHDRDFHEASIVVTGLSAGEKLVEELTEKGTSLTAVRQHIHRVEAIPVSTDLAQIERLVEMARHAEVESVREAIAKLFFRAIQH